MVLHELLLRDLLIKQENKEDANSQKVRQKNHPRELLLRKVSAENSQRAFVAVDFEVELVSRVAFQALGVKPAA